MSQVTASFQLMLQYLMYTILLSFNKYEEDVPPQPPLCNCSPHSPSSSPNCPPPHILKSFPFCMGQRMGSLQITLYKPSVLRLQLWPKSFFCLAKIHTHKYK